MKRRQFVENTLRALPLYLTLPTLIGACKEEVITPNGKSVAIIGAGIAGLSAAQMLRKNGFDVTLLEAQDKVGGRLKTNRSLDIPFDEGASWIHGPRRNPITNLAEQAGATTFLTDDNNQVAFDINGQLYSDRFVEDMENEYDKALKAVLNAGVKDKSFETVFNNLYPNRLNMRIWKYLLSAYLEFDTGADISQLSSIDFDDDEVFNGDDVIITNGYDRVAEFLAKDLNIRLNSPVSSINYEGKKVKIGASNQTLETDFVLVTVSLGVLKRERITFTPAMPKSKQQAIRNIGMGNVNKFLLVWENAFWDTNLQYIAYTPEVKGKFNYFLNLRTFTATNALMTFALGNYASITEQKSDNEIIDEIMAHLKVIYGNNIPKPSKFLRTAWGNNPYTFGAYSFAANNGRTTDFDVLAAQIENKVFFAGEHTSKDYRGTVHGAYLSGLSAAKKIMDL
jgi:monoamine oxidase